MVLLSLIGQRWILILLIQVSFSFLLLITCDFKQKLYSQDTFDLYFGFYPDIQVQIVVLSFI